MTKSELYETNYRIELNKERLPFIAETKFILVPVYGVSGTIKDTSIMQEHKIGSNEYVLSLETPTKKLKLAY